MKRQLELLPVNRIILEESIEITAMSMKAYGPNYPHWAIAFSGGKDSTATATIILHLLETGRIPAPETLTILYSDTRMELPPLHNCAISVLRKINTLKIGNLIPQGKVVLPTLDDRFFVYMFGRGVPPPKNRFRWCTPQLKVEPMIAALQDLREYSGEKLLMLTGVRLGESAIRDDRIKTSCTRDGAECGQGWFQESTPDSIADTLAPLLHWRVCHVWDWLTFFAPDMGFDTADIAEIYGGEEKTEINARTGCVGCNLASRDFALDRVLKIPHWQYLHPLKKLKPLYQELKKPQYRLRKDGTERRKDGNLVKNPHRLGPLTFDARRWGLSRILDIQNEINQTARLNFRPLISLINDEELQRIHELIEADTWPNGWEGTEQRGDLMTDEVLADGIVQPLLGNIFNKGLTNDRR